MATASVGPGPALSSARNSGTSATQASAPGPRDESATTPRAPATAAPTSRQAVGWLLAVLLPVLAIFAVCTSNAVDWIGRPFSGFLFLENGIAVSIGRAGWSETRYRSVPFARVLAVQLIGFGLAAAVLLDATLIRMVLVPAIMHIAGRWNWWPGVRAPRPEQEASN